MRAKPPHRIEKHADIASQADGAKALLDPVRGRLGRCGQESGRDAVAPASRNQCIHGGEASRMIELRGNAHRDGEIVMAYPSDIYTGNGDDLIEILECLLRFEQQNHASLRICLGEELRTAGAIEIVGDAESNSSSPGGRIFELGDDVLGLLARLHAWNHHSARADIECSRKWRESQIGNTRHGEDVRAAAGCDHLREQVDVAAAVLHIENHKIQAARSEHGPDTVSEELEYHLAEHHLSAPEPLKETAHRRPPGAASAAL